MKTFGEKLKQAMQKLHLNQIQVSGLTGKSKGSISQYLSDKQVPPEETQVDIALALGLAEDYFSDKNDKFSVLPTKEIRNKIIPRLDINEAAKMLGISEEENRVEYHFKGVVLAPKEDEEDEEPDHDDGDHDSVRSAS